MFASQPSCRTETNHNKPLFPFGCLYWQSNSRDLRGEGGQADRVNNQFPLHQFLNNEMRDDTKSRPKKIVLTTRAHLRSWFLDFGENRKKNFIQTNGGKWHFNVIHKNGYFDEIWSATANFGQIKFSHFKNNNWKLNLKFGTQFGRNNF